MARRLKSLRNLELWRLQLLHEKHPKDSPGPRTKWFPGLRGKLLWTDICLAETPNVWSPRRSGWAPPGASIPMALPPAADCPSHWTRYSQLNFWMLLAVQLSTCKKVHCMPLTTTYGLVFTRVLRSPTAHDFSSSGRVAGHLSFAFNISHMPCVMWECDSFQKSSSNIVKWRRHSAAARWNIVIWYTLFIWTYGKRSNGHVYNMKFSQQIQLQSLGYAKSRLWCKPLRHKTIHQPTCPSWSWSYWHGNKKIDPQEVKRKPHLNTWTKAHANAAKKLFGM